MVVLRITIWTAHSRHYSKITAQPAMNVCKVLKLRCKNRESKWLQASNAVLSSFLTTDWGGQNSQANKVTSHRLPSTPRPDRQHHHMLLTKITPPLLHVCSDRGDTALLTVLPTQVFWEGHIHKLDVNQNLVVLSIYQKILFCGRNG